MSQRTAFDTLAPTYDDVFTNTHIGQFLRQKVHNRLLTHFSAGDHVLEMGCGTGADALFLAEHDIRVTATDASKGMIAQTQQKIGDHPHISVHHLDLRHLETPTDFANTPKFNGAFANFGVLNCLNNWHPLAEWLAERVKINGVVGFGVMAPYCLWEILWHGAHADISTAFRRFRKSTMFQPETMIESIQVVYPTVKRLQRDFAPMFVCEHVRPLGIALPPSDIYGVIEKRPRLLKRLMQAEKLLARTSLLALFADHYWIEFRRVDTI